MRKRNLYHAHTLQSLKSSLKDSAPKQQVFHSSPPSSSPPAPSSSSSSSSASKPANSAQPATLPPLASLPPSLDHDPTMNQLDDIISNIERMQVPHANNSLRFEFTLLLFLLCHLCIQNYNIYRLNFYNYNFHLLILTSIILCKRLLVKYLKSVKRENPFSMSTSQICFNLLVLASILSNSFYFVYQLFSKHLLKNFLFLFYPAVSYFLFFGYNANKNRTPTEKAMFKFKKLLFNTIECGYFAGFLPLKFLQSEHIYFDPIRAIILILFLLVNCFVMFFTHLLSTSFYELYIHAHTFGCWCSCTSSYKISYFGSLWHFVKDPTITTNLSKLQSSAKITPPPSPTRKGAAPQNKLASGKNTGQVPHKASAKSDAPSVHEWNPKHGPYPRGSVVLHEGKVYVAIGLWNSSEPGNWNHGFLFFLFAKPDRVHTMLIILQAFVVTMQLVMVFHSTNWRVYSVMLLLNYHILYTCMLTRRENLPYYSYYHFNRAE
eukprot:Phypoly_transcript_08381.p1 GENE.Phypoly_transcript_08381~~Phypoly_transcript_08381.p1  ORF type:complete len:490 (+),score=66.27 Phypoly_transcript_08381:41-1510(+)